jgi:site-specific DNA-methyltransferase (adenine-specific)
MSSSLRLFHADCLSIIGQIPLHTLKAICTSPPYNLGKVYGPNVGDKMPRGTYLEWCHEWLRGLCLTVAGDGHLFLNVGGIPSDPTIPYDVLAEAIKAGWKLQNHITWVKSIAVSDTLSYGHFRPVTSPRFVNDCVEEIWHLTPLGKSPIERKAEGVGVAYQDPGNAKRWANGADGRRCAGNAWFLPYKTVNASEQKEHPCPFPLELPLRCLRLAGVGPGDWVLDPFMGRGTTGEAALKLGASFAGVELEQEWFTRAEANLNKAKDLREAQPDTKQPLPWVV